MHAANFIPSATPPPANVIPIWFAAPLLATLVPGPAPALAAVVLVVVAVLELVVARFATDGETAPPPQPAMISTNGTSNADKAAARPSPTRRRRSDLTEALVSIISRPLRSAEGQTPPKNSAYTNIPSAVTPG
jgi:hypothetical protein